MPLSKSPLAYNDCKAVLDRALASEKGIEVLFADKDRATAFRYRLNQARRMSRKDNRDIYPAGHRLHGWSEYDTLTLELHDKTIAGLATWNIRIVKTETREFEIKEL